MIHAVESTELAALISEKGRLDDIIKLNNSGAMNVEKDEVLKRYLDINGVVKAWPGKAQNRLVILEYLASKFEPGKQYSEQEINLILMKYLDDYVTRRRDLIEYHFLTRTDDGRFYWVNQQKQKNAD